MYKVYCDGNLLYADQLKEYMIFEPKLELEINKAGTFEFTIYPTHPCYGTLKKMRSIITVYQNDDLIFRGRILNMDTGWLNQIAVSCEGDLAFLNDSIMSPYEWDADTTLKTMRGVISGFIDNHNAQMKWIEGIADDDYIKTFKQFELGDITGFDDVEVRIANDDYESTWENIETLIKEYGGYLSTSHKDGKTYLNYSKDYSNEIINQPIEFGKNILDIIHSANGEDVFTGILPLGAESTVDERIGRITIDVENPNGKFNKSYLLDNDVAKEFGVILKKVDFNEVRDDEDNPSYCPEKDLLDKGNERMQNAGLIAEEIEIKAVDLSILDKDFDSFKIGTSVAVYDKYHGVYSVEDGKKKARIYQVTKLDIELLSPDKNKITIGSTGQSLTDQSAANIINQNVSLQNINKKVESLEITGASIQPMSSETIGGIIGT